jgi:hypothetical protein
MFLFNHVAVFTVIKKNEDTPLQTLADRRLHVEISFHTDTGQGMERKISTF